LHVCSADLSVRHKKTATTLSRAWPLATTMADVQITFSVTSILPRVALE
jgi:hypothetical protein